MSDESVSLIGSAPVKTPNDKEFVERVRQEAQYRAGQAPAKVTMIAPDAVSVIVMDPKNPHLSLYRELRAGIINLEEFLEAIDCQVCKEETLEGFKWKSGPEKPVDLHNAELEINMQCAKMGETKKREVMKDFQLQVQEQFKSYFKAADKVNEENLSNLHTLRDMLKRQKEKNLVFAARIQAVLDTH